MDAWNELSPELQNIVLDCADQAVEDGLTYIDDALAGGLQDLEDVGVETISWPADEMTRFRELACYPVWEDWIAEQEAAGLPGQTVFDNYNIYLGKYR
jgi:TRAP-type C4-dicarboxylate transport system substrate-binding protein